MSPQTILAARGLSSDDMLYNEDWVDLLAQHDLAREQADLDLMEEVEEEMTNLLDSLDVDAEADVPGWALFD
jgi:translation elongation factor EF-Tu-like GTPase